MPASFSGVGLLKLSLIIGSILGSSNFGILKKLKRVGFFNWFIMLEKKLEKKSLVTFIYVGKPTQELRSKMGSETRLQLNDQFAEVSEIETYIAQEKSSMKEEDQPFMTVSIKADKETKMGVITDVKQALREAYALKISYSARQAVD